MNILKTQQNILRSICGKGATLRIFAEAGVRSLLLYRRSKGKGRVRYNDTYNMYMYAMRIARASSFSFVFLLLSGLVANVQAQALPSAVTVSLLDSVNVIEGMVVSAQEDTGAYVLSGSIDDAQVYGVVAAQPPVVFATEGTNTSVITEGIALLRVNNQGGAIQRGDLLVTSLETGVAMKASEEQVYVFAIALQALQESQGVIQAEIGAERAQLLRAQQREIAAAALAEDLTVEDPKKLSFIRAAIAVLLVVGALGFLLYSFRSLLTHGVVSVGRNPRAKGSIMTFSFANFVFALILSAAVVFIAVAVLVLPL